MWTAASPVRFDDRPVIVVMGVSGVGKTTVGRALARALDLPYRDGDDVHPPANVEKMARGIPLTDADRWPWLDSLGHVMADAAGAHGGVVAAWILHATRAERSGRVLSA